MTRILIADDHELVRRGLRQILAEVFSDLAVGDATDGGQTLLAVEKQSWDLVLLDINMPGRSGIDVLQDLNEIPQATLAKLAGAATEMCLVQSAIDARELGFKVTIVADACSTVDEEMERLSLEYVRRVVGAEVVLAADLDL